MMRRFTTDELRELAKLPMILTRARAERHDLKTGACPKTMRLARAL